MITDLNQFNVSFLKPVFHLQILGKRNPRNKSPAIHQVDVRRKLPKAKFCYK